MRLVFFQAEDGIRDLVRSRGLGDVYKRQLKDHVCTDACKDGNHVYAHGEKGHACSAECMKMHEGDAMLKEHVCTAACRNGEHVYAHGEQGHVCDATCKGSMEMKE